MRQYRGLTKDGKWIYGWLVIWKGISFIIDDAKMNEHSYMEGDNRHVIAEWLEVIPETVGQQIGRKDRNGKEIYEGDKVSSGFWGGTVEFKKGAFKIIQGGYADSSNFDIVEIIGNVHQPEPEEK